MTIGTDLDALLAKAARLTAAPAPPPDQRQAIAQAAYLGNGDQQAAMNLARQTGDTDAIAQQRALAQARAEAALVAFDRVFGAGGSPDAQRASGGPENGVRG